MVIQVWSAADGTESYEPPGGPDTLIPLGSPGTVDPGQPDHEPREPLSLEFEMTDRFLHVRFHDYLEKPDHGLFPSPSPDIPQT